MHHRAQRVGTGGERRLQCRVGLVSAALACRACRQQGLLRAAAPAGHVPQPRPPAPPRSRDINGRTCRVAHQQQRNQPGGSSRAADYGSGRTAGSRGDYGGGRGGAGGRGGRGGRRDELGGGDMMAAAAAGGMLGAGMLPGMVMPGMMPAGMMGECWLLRALVGAGWVHTACRLPRLCASDADAGAHWAAAHWSSGSRRAAVLLVCRAAYTFLSLPVPDPNRCASHAAAGMAMPSMEMMQGMMMMPGMQGMVPFGMPGATGRGLAGLEGLGLQFVRRANDSSGMGCTDAARVAATSSLQRGVSPCPPTCRHARIQASATAGGAPCQEGVTAA